MTHEIHAHHQRHGQPFCSVPRSLAGNLGPLMYEPSRLQPDPALAQMPSHVQAYLGRYFRAYFRVPSCSPGSFAAPSLIPGGRALLGDQARAAIAQQRPCPKLRLVMPPPLSPSLLVPPRLFEIPSPPPASVTGRRCRACCCSCRGAMS